MQATEDLLENSIQCITEKDIYEYNAIRGIVLTSVDWKPGEIVNEEV